MNTLFKIILLMVLTTAVFAGVYFGFQFTQLKKQEVENAARYQCATSSTYSVVDKKATVSYPVSDLYAKCLREKGIR